MKSTAYSGFEHLIKESFKSTSYLSPLPSHLCQTLLLWAHTKRSTTLKSSIKIQICLLCILGSNHLCNNESFEINCVHTCSCGINCTNFLFWLTVISLVLVCFLLDIVLPLLAGRIDVEVRFGLGSLAFVNIHSTPK